MPPRAGRVSGLVSLVCALLVLACSLLHVSGYPSGAPASACATQDPRHGGADSSGTGGYLMSFPGQSNPAAPTYTVGTPLQVRITAPAGVAPWKGHLASVHLATDGSFVGTLQFDEAVSYGLCQSYCRNQLCGFTHGDPDPKTDLLYTWTPPDVVGTGPVLVRITLVETFTGGDSVWYKLETRVAEVEGTNPPDVMAAPMVLQVAANSGAQEGTWNLTLGWTAPFKGSRPIINYILTQSVNGSAPVVAYTGLALSVQFTNVPSLTTLVYTIRANNTWEAAPSPELVVHVPATGSLAPPAPVGLGLDNSVDRVLGSLALRWTPNNDSSTVQWNGYELQQKVLGQPDSAFVSIYFGADPHFVWTGLNATRPYVFRVASLNVAGASPWSAPPVTIDSSAWSCGQYGVFDPASRTCACVDGVMGLFCETPSRYTQANEHMPCFGQDSRTYCIDMSAPYTNQHGEAELALRLYGQYQPAGGEHAAGALGYIALGFGASDGMSGARMIVFTFDPLPSYRTTHAHFIQSSGFSRPSGAMAPVLPEGRYVGIYNETFYDVRFQLTKSVANSLGFDFDGPEAAPTAVTAAAAGEEEEEDEAVDDSASSSAFPLSWAVHHTYFDQHSKGSYGRLRFDPSTGVLYDVTGSSDLSYAFYAPYLVAMGVIFIGCMLFNLSPRVYRSRLGVCCLRKRPSTLFLSAVEHDDVESLDDSLPPTVPGSNGPASSRSEWWERLMDACTLDIRPTMANWTWGDMVVFASYAVGVAVTAAIGYATYDTSASYRRHYIFGHMVAMQFAAMFLPVNRGGLFVSTLGVSFERAVAWHRIMARICVGFLLIHIVSMVHQQGSGMLTSLHSTAHGFGVGWGSLSFLSVAAMVATSWEPVRRRCFDLFYVTHLLFFPLAVVFACMHNELVRYYLIAALALIVLDRIPGRLRSFAAVRIEGIQVLQGAGARNEQGEAGAEVPTSSANRLVRLELSKPISGLAAEFSYSAGDYAFINIPELALFAWHPFSFTSIGATNPDTLTFHILDMGPGTYTHALTHRLVELVAARSEGGGGGGSRAGDDLVVKIDGPYGRLSVPPGEYATVVLVAGGIGVTPLYALLQQLLHTYSQQEQGGTSSSPLRALHLIWVSRAPASFTEWFPSLVADLYPRFNKVLHLHFFYTGPGGVAGSAPVKDVVEGRVSGRSLSRRGTTVDATAAVHPVLPPASHHASLGNTVKLGLGGNRMSVAVNNRLEEPEDDEDAFGAPRRPSGSTRGVQMSVPSAVAAIASSHSSEGEELAAPSSSPPAAAAADFSRPTPPRRAAPAAPSAQPTTPPAAAAAADGFADAERDRAESSTPPPPSSLPPPPEQPPAVPAPHEALLDHNPAVTYPSSSSSSAASDADPQLSSPLSPIMVDEESGAQRIPINVGRPHLGALFARIQRAHIRSLESSSGAARPLQPQVACYVCGPQPLIDETQDHAMRREWHLHKETFAL